MNSNQLSARLCCEDVAKILNCQSADIPTLVAKKLLKPLGSPQNNATKYYSRAAVMELAADEKWLARITNAIYEASREKNAKRKVVGFTRKAA